MKKGYIIRPFTKLARSRIQSFVKNNTQVLDGVSKVRHISFYLKKPSSPFIQTNLKDTTTVRRKTVLIFRQILDKETSTYTYLVADSTTKEAIIVDPVKEQVGRDLKLIKELELSLKYVLDTHIHADHVTGAYMLRHATNCKIILPSPFQNTIADMSIRDNQKLQIGDVTVTAIATPGHTEAHMAYLINDDRILTGNALLIRSCGRTDFPEGNSATLYDSVIQRLFTLPEETLVFPGHDYNGFICSTIGEEKQYNPRLAQKTKEEFVEVMRNLNLPKPAKMNECVLKNQKSGQDNDMKLSKSSTVSFWKELTSTDIINAQSLKNLLSSSENFYLIDVRSEGEYRSGPLDVRATNIPLNQLKEKFKELDPNKLVVVYCYSGNRSGKAMQLLRENNFKSVLNLEGGIIKWSETFNLDALKKRADESVKEFRKESVSPPILSKF